MKHTTLALLIMTVLTSCEHTQSVPVSDGEIRGIYLGIDNSRSESDNHIPIMVATNQLRPQSIDTVIFYIPEPSLNQIIIEHGKNQLFDRVLGCTFTVKPQSGQRFGYYYPSRPHHIEVDVSTVRWKSTFSSSL